MTRPQLELARARIADCLQVDTDGALVQRRDSLNLAGLGLTATELAAPFDPAQRGLPELSLGDLCHLRYLDLTGNQLEELPRCLCDFQELVWLGLNFNRITALPEAFTRLNKLQRLYLRNNGLEQLPEAIGFLSDLVEFDLTGCPIRTLPSSMGHLGKLEHIELDVTALDPDQQAVWKEKQWVSLRQHLMRVDEHALAVYRASTAHEARRKSYGNASPYYDKLVEGARSLHELRTVLQQPEVFWFLDQLRRAEEAERTTTVGVLRPTQFTGKVVLVGDQENGKTCLQRALRNLSFIKGHKSTDGMSRERLHLSLEGVLVSPKSRASNPGPRAEVIDLTLWDMGGQESYQHAHQMFFTPSAVYLVVTLARQGGSVQRLDHWIDLVKRRTDGQASIIVVSTWCRDPQCKPDKAVKLDDLRSRHGDVVRDLVPVDSQDGTGIQELRKRLAEVLQEPRARCGHTWLPGWAEVMGALANRSEAFLRWESIATICEQAGIGEAEEQRQVIRTGNLIGALTWREDIPAGEDVVILNPDWLCRAVARLLDDDETRKAHGLVRISELDRVWAGEGRDGTPGYAREMYQALIELMEINELAYRPRVPDRRIGDGDLLLVTQMVQNTPEQDYEATWERLAPKDSAETVRVVAFRKPGKLGYEDVVDLIYLLIFRLRKFSLGRTNYHQARHWQRGLLVTDDYGSAGRIDLENQCLRITVRHRLGDGLMHSIVHRIGMRDDGYWSGRGLEKVEFVPCGPACVNGTPDRGLILIEDCAKAVRIGNRAVSCRICNELVLIDALLNARATSVPDQNARIEKAEARIVEAIRQEGAITRRVVTTESQATRNDIADLAGLVRMQGDGILDAFTSEWKEGPRLFSLIPIKRKGVSLKSATEVEFRLTLWCEASRRPVPLFRERKQGEAGGFKGSENITLTREWLQTARKLLTWSKWGFLTLVSVGTAGLAGLVTATGGVIEQTDASAWAAELARQQKAISDVVAAIPDDSKHALRGHLAGAEPDGSKGFGSPERLGFGAPVEEDLKLVRYLREEFKKKDPTWGGLEPRSDGKFGRIWAHPKAPHGDER